MNKNDILRYSILAILLLAVSVLIFIYFQNNTPKSRAYDPNERLSILTQLLKSESSKNLFSLNALSEEELVSIALERKAILLELVESDPKSILEYSLTKDERSKLPTAFFDLGLLEKDLQIEGKINYIIIDDFENNTAEHLFKIDKYNIHFTDKKPI